MGKVKIVSWPSNFDDVLSGITVQTTSSGYDSSDCNTNNCFLIKKMDGLYTNVDMGFDYFIDWSMI